MIYLASPYSHPEASVREYRFRRICAIAGKLMEEGNVIFCPIAMGHPIACAHPTLPTDWEYWKLFGTEFLHASEKLIVAKMNGWESSAGVTGEIAIANEIGIPVEYMEG
jgi:hypothetical protein